MVKQAIITLSSSSVGQPAGNFTTQMNPVLNLDQGEEYQIGLLSYTIFFTVINVYATTVVTPQGGTKLKNNTFNITNVSNTHYPNQIGATLNVVIPQGNYSFDQLAAYINTQVVANYGPSTATGSFTNVVPAVLVGIAETQKTAWTLAQGFEVDMTLSAFNVLVGFNSEVVPAGGAGAPDLSDTYTSENQANIAYGFTSFNIGCDAVDPRSSLSTVGNNGKAGPSNIFYNSGFNVPQGFSQNVNLGYSNITFVSLLPAFINNSQILIQVTDSTGQILDFQQGTPPNYTNNASSFQIVIRKAPKI